MTEARARRGEHVGRGRLGASRVLLAAVLASGCGGESGARPDSAAVADSLGARLADSVAVVADTTAAAPGEVTEFLRFVEERRLPAATTDGGELASEGLRRLVAAIDAIAMRDTASDEATRGRVVVLRGRADSLLVDTVPAERARRAGEAFVLASDLLQTLQARGQPTLTDRAAEARQAAAAIRSDQPLREQTDGVRRFLERAAAALRGMVGTRTV